MLHERNRSLYPIFKVCNWVNLLKLGFAKQSHLSLASKWAWNLWSENVLARAAWFMYFHATCASKTSLSAHEKPVIDIEWCTPTCLAPTPVTCEGQCNIRMWIYRSVDQMQLHRSIALFDFDSNKFPEQPDEARGTVFEIQIANYCKTPVGLRKPL